MRILRRFLIRGIDLLERLISCMVKSEDISIYHLQISVSYCFNLIDGCYGMRKRGIFH